MTHLLDKLPAVLADRLRTRFGWHFSRFALVAFTSVGVTQVTLLLVQLAGVTAGKATLAGWMAGALTSYLLSRWAWQRKGRPSVVKETLPFWIISLGTAAVLTTTGHFAGTFAKSHDMAGFDRLLVVNGAVLIANAVTFVLRFLIFHYVLFADRAAGSAEPAPAGSDRGRSSAPAGSSRAGSVRL